jgi:hypothetical protein
MASYIEILSVAGLLLMAGCRSARGVGERPGGESKWLVVESPWSQLTSECQRFSHPPRLDK